MTTFAFTKDLKFDIKMEYGLFKLSINGYDVVYSHILTSIFVDYINNSDKRLLPKHLKFKNFFSHQTDKHADLAKQYNDAVIYFNIYFHLNYENFD